MRLRSLVLAWAKLLSYAYAFEQSTRWRQAPVAFNPDLRPRSCR